MSCPAPDQPLAIPSQCVLCSHFPYPFASSFARDRAANNARHLTAHARGRIDFQMTREHSRTDCCQCEYYPRMHHDCWAEAVGFRLGRFSCRLTMWWRHFLVYTWCRANGSYCTSGRRPYNMTTQPAKCTQTWRGSSALSGWWRTHIKNNLHIRYNKHIF